MNNKEVRNALRAAEQLSRQFNARELALKHPTFVKRNPILRAIKSLSRLDKAKIRQVEGKPWTWAFHELPDATKVEPGRQILRRALAQTAYKNLRSKYGGMLRKDLRILAQALTKKTFKELPRKEVVAMYRKAEGLGRVE